MLGFAYGSWDALDGWSVKKEVARHAAMDKYLFERFEAHIASCIAQMAQEMINASGFEGFVDLFLHVLEYPNLQMEAIRRGLKTIAVQKLENLTIKSEIRSVFDA